MTYLLSSLIALSIAVLVVLRKPLINRFARFSGGYVVDRRIELGGVIMLAFPITIGWCVGFVDAAYIELSFIAAIVGIMFGFVVLAVGLTRESKQWF